MICIWSSWCHCHPIISCHIKIQNGLTFLLPAYPGCPGKKAIRWVSVCMSGSIKTFVLHHVIWSYRGVCGNTGIQGQFRLGFVSKARLWNFWTRFLQAVYGTCLLHNWQCEGVEGTKLSDDECYVDVAKDAAQDSFVEKLVANVIKNLEVTVTNIHVRFEDSVTNPKKPFSVGVTLRELSLRVRLTVAVHWLCYTCLHCFDTVG